ncbi:hypothetical protein DICPUDRAFT_38082 [Dictyostelium purpureum]|uniref:SAP domain-containing protein n=1 Tax=Dictyostelium purpureum TaxID=5786 RepID=F0ZTR7_DICPU|nr:uncharacterized protein DICPUDRAFT_38082 [Dictyostelium purpureum]EGC32653.1 hypothetical protein DICPUDRAFT_38082 [Dictyostelium purpureum]|eukprot:XP_003290822.1 hypothetical protein DICPUDRAFT_38082 [Dictyostelium purpureum]
MSTTNPTIVNKELSNINEDILYNSLCFLSFDSLLECLVSIGYENDIESVGNQKSDLVNRLVNDSRELGIEDFIQRLNFETITETCSLLSLSGVNGDTDEEILENSRKQLEDKMKRDSLDQFFYSLTPHILSQFCNCLKIKLPPPTTTNENSESNESKETEEEEEEEEKDIEEMEEKEETKTISTSIPSIKVGADGTTVLSTLSTKSTYKKYKNRGIQYGDSIVEGVFYENIIRLVRDEILLCGVENLFSFLPKQKLLPICESLKINIKPTDKMSDIITKVTSKLFNIDLIHDQKQQQQQFITPIRTRNNLQYPKTPSSASESEDNSDNKNNNDNSNNNNNINEADSANNTNSCNSNNNSPRSNKNKRKLEEETEESDNSNNETTDDSEIDQPAKRPLITDIKNGITKEDLSCYLVKDLRQWLQKKGLKYTDKKSVLENRILKYLENENEATSASESEDKEKEKKTPSKKLKSKHN